MNVEVAPTARTPPTRRRVHHRAEHSRPPKRFTGCNENKNCDLARSWPTTQRRISCYAAAFASSRLRGQAEPARFHMKPPGFTREDVLQSCRFVQSGQPHRPPCALCEYFKRARWVVAAPSSAKKIDMEGHSAIVVKSSRLAEDMEGEQQGNVGTTRSGGRGIAVWQGEREAGHQHAGGACLWR